MQILIHTASDTGFQWLAGALSGSTDGWTVKRADNWATLARDARQCQLVIHEEGENEWSAPSWEHVRDQLESLGAPWVLYLSVFDFPSREREEAFARRITLQRKPCGARELLKRVEDLAL